MSVGARESERVVELALESVPGSEPESGLGSEQELALEGGSELATRTLRRLGCRS